MSKLKKLEIIMKSPQSEWDCYEGWMVGNMVSPHTIGAYISFSPQVDFAGLELYNYGITKGG